MKTIRRSSALLLAAVAIAAVFFAAIQGTDTARSGAQAEMALVVDPHGERCSTVCTIPLGGTFTLAVEIVEAPAGGYIGVQSFIDYGDNLTYDVQARPIESEIVWPELEPQVAVKASTGPGLITHGGLSTILPPFPVSTYTGSFVELEMSCSAGETSTIVDLLPYRDFQANTSGSAFALPGGRDIAVVPGDALQVDCGAGGPLDTPTPIQPPTETPTPWPTLPMRTPRPPVPREPFSPPEGGTGPAIIIPQGPTFPGDGLFVPVGDSLLLDDDLLGFLDITTTAAVSCRAPATANDAAIILHWHAGLIGGAPCGPALDVTSDGVVDSRDAAVVMQHAAGLLATLPL